MSTRNGLAHMFEESIPGHSITVQDQCRGLTYALNQMLFKCFATPALQALMLAALRSLKGRLV